MIIPRLCILVLNLLFHINQELICFLIVCFLISSQGSTVVVLWRIRELILSKKSIKLNIYRKGSGSEEYQMFDKLAQSYVHADHETKGILQRKVANVYHWIT